jgi:transposase
MQRKRKAKTKTGAIRSLINAHAAGVDIGSREMHAAVAPGLDAGPVRCYATFTDELKKLVAWFRERGIKTVALEATGVCWIALAELLEEAQIEVCPVNPRHVKNAPGRKSGARDCQWLQYPHPVGLLRAAFRPPAQVRAIRSLWRHRDSLARQSAWHARHMHKAPDRMNLQTHHVIPDITGKGGGDIVKAILEGERDAKTLAMPGDKRLKAGPAILLAALTGDYRDEHRFCLGQARDGYEFTLKPIAQVDARLETMLIGLKQEPPPGGRPVQTKPRPRRGRPAGYDAGKLLHGCLGVDPTGIPGINTNTAQTLHAELGGDLRAFKSGRHFASWPGLNPDNRISGKKGLGAHLKPCGNRVARALRMAAQGLHHANNEPGDYYRRMKARPGGAAGLVAVARKLARIIHAVMTTRKAHEAALHKQAAARRLVRSLEHLRKKAKPLGFELTAIQQPA